MKIAGMTLKGVPTFSKRALIINAMLGTTILAGFASFIHTTFARPYAEVCTARYHRQLSLKLDRDGEALTPADVQAFSNGQDEGVLENLSIAAFNTGPSKYAMGIKIAEKSMEQRTGRGPAGGVSFPWMPSSIEQPQAACLSYNVFLPADFDFGTGGTLPGFFGATVNGQFGDTPGFSTQLGWGEGGAPKVYLQIKADPAARAAAFPAYDRTIPRGRWVRVDQELVLNSANQPDGVARLWFDGKLEAEVKAAEIRPGAEVAIAGVTGDVYYGGSGTMGIAPKEATVWLSPFELRWN